MKEKYYTIAAENGVHARPDGYLVKKASEFRSEISISCNGKTASAKKLFALMKLGIKKGDTIHISVTGSDEEVASQTIFSFIEENF